MNKLLTILLTVSLILGQGLLGESFTHNRLMAQSGKKKSKRGSKKSKKGSEKTGIDPKKKEKLDYFFIEANTQYLEGEKNEAINLFKQVLNIDPNHHASMYNIGRISAQLGDFETATKYARMALDGNPNNYWYYVELVHAYEEQKQIEKALEIQEKLVEKFPEDKNARFDLAQLHITNRDYAKAVTEYDALEKLIGMNEEVIFRKHQLYVYLEQPEKALAEIDKLIAFNPSDERFYQAKYDVYMMQGDDDKALAVLTELVKVDPENGFALLSLADYYKSKGEIAKSDEYLYRAFENPNVDLESKVKILGSLYQYSGTDPSMQNRLDRLSKMLYTSYPDSPMVMAVRGDIFQVAGALDSASHYYRKAIKADPVNEQAWQELLLLDSDRGDFAQMQKDAEKALEYFPNQVVFLYFFGVGSSESGDSDEAIYAFEKIKKVGEANQDLLLQSFLSLGQIYHEEEQYGKSDENFEAALKMAPGNPSALNNFAYFLSLRNEKLDHAEEMVKQALTIEPNNAAYQDTYGWILYLKGDFSAAEEWIGKAIAGGGTGEVYEHYGDAWIKLGNPEKAKEYWEKANETGSRIDLDDKMKKAGIK